MNVSIAHHASVISLSQSLSSTTGSSFSTDDYGEADVSLQSYRRTIHQEDAAASGSLRRRISREDANKLLIQRLGQFIPSSGARLQVSKTGKCSFETASGTIELCIREDHNTDAVTISTVVHKTNHSNILASQMGRPQGAYSLMTKMMKHNALLSRSNAGRICAHDGVFVFFTHMDVMDLCIEGRIEAALESVMLHAVEIRKEFTKTSDPTSGRQHIRRRRYLLGAYNRTLITKGL